MSEPTRTRTRPSRDAVRAETVWPFYLLRPCVRYAPSSDAVPDAVRSVRRRWQPRTASAWTWDDGTLTLDVMVRPLDQSDGRSPAIFTLAATAVQPARIGMCIVELAFPCRTAPHYVDRTLRMATLRGTTILNDYTPLVVQWTNDGITALELRNWHGFTACRLAWRGTWLRVGVPLDAAALHPRWQFTRGHRSEAAPLTAAGRTWTVRLSLSAHPCGANPETIALGRFPRGREAAFTLTDHCDFDSEDRLRTFLHGDGLGAGWLGRGLRLTKSVFAIAQSPESAPAATLGDARYRALIRELADDGSEIVPHSLSEGGGLKPDAIDEALAALATDWSPRTWIDHGYLPYNYTMGGGTDPEYRLLERLRARGFVALAAGHDIPADAYGSLNMLARPRSDAHSVAEATWLHLRQRRIGVALRYLRVAIRRRLVGPSGYLLDGILLSLASVLKFWGRTRRLSRANWNESWGMAWRRFQAFAQEGPRAMRLPYSRDELLEMAAVAYPERGVPLNQSTADDTLLFTTMEAIHTKDIYTPRALECLIAERGLHIGHSYLLNELPYIAGIFNTGARERRLSPEWLRFVAALSDAANGERLWNPCVSDLLLFMRDVQHVQVVRDTANQSVQLTNWRSAPLSEVTVLLPRETLPDDVRWAEMAPKGWRYWDDWLAVWGDLPAESAIVVRWDSTRQRAKLA